MLADIANKGGLNGDLAKVLLEHPNVKKAKIGLFTQQEKDTMDRPVPPASAFSKTGEIKFDNEQFGSLVSFERTLLHEVLHIATSNEWNAYSLDKAGYTAKFAQKADVLKTLDNFRERIIAYLNNGRVITLSDGTVIDKAGLDDFNKKQKESGYKDYDNSDVGFFYGLTNTKEFISVLMTESMMQEALSKIPYGQGKTLWDRIQDLFTNFVKHLSKQFGRDVNKTVLSESVGNVLDLLTLREVIVKKEEKQVSEPIQVKQEIEKLITTPAVEYTSNTSKVTNSVKVNGIDVKTSVFKDGKEIGITLNKDQEAGLREFANYFDAWKNGKTSDAHFKLFARGGRGKTSLVKSMMDYIKKSSKNRYSVGVSTPTHKAGKVATFAIFGKHTGYSTVASMINKIKNNQPVPKIWIFDEVSMVGSWQYETLLKYADNNNIFILSMGDQAQLPPVKEPGGKISKFFDKKVGKIYNLTQPMRFGKESGIFAISESVANNVKILNGGIEQYGNSEQGDVEILSSSGELVDNFMKYFYPVVDDIKEKSLIKLIAYSNNAVAMYNNLIRRRLFGVEAVEKQVVKGDILMGQLNWGENPLKVPIQNAQDYVVVSEPEEKTSKITYTYLGIDRVFNLKYLKIAVQEPNSSIGDVPKNVQWIDLKEEQNKEFGQFIFDLYTKLGTYKTSQEKWASDERFLLEMLESDGWLVPNNIYRSNSTKQVYQSGEIFDVIKKHYKLTNQNEVFAKYEQLLESGSLIALKGNIQHGYAITSHASQGSTYKTVLVDDKNISYREKDRLVNNLDGTFEGYEANHMRYVAFSRPTEKLIIFTEKQTGDKLVLSTDKADNAIAKSSKESIKKQSLISVSDNIVSVESVDSFLKDLSPKERILFTKLKLNKTIETDCK